MRLICIDQYYDIQTEVFLLEVIQRQQLFFTSLKYLCNLKSGYLKKNAAVIPSLLSCMLQ